MKLNRQILQINRNFAICFVAAAVISAAVAHMLSDYENYLNTTITVAAGYVSFFGIFVVLFFLDNKSRYKQMESSLIRKEVIKITFSFGVGEIVYLVTRWITLYYLLEISVEAYLASLISSAIAAVVNMIVISVFLKKTKTF